MADKIIVMHDAGIYRELRMLRKKSRRLGFVVLALCLYELTKNVKVVKIDPTASEENTEGA